MRRPLLKIFSECPIVPKGCNPTPRPRLLPEVGVVEGPVEW
jgi:hypothetical protein